MAGEVKGVDDLVAVFKQIPNDLRKRVMRNALAAGAREVRNEAQRLAPVLSVQDATKAPYRTPGLLRKSIAVRTSKIARRAGDVGVFVNVKPAKGANRGAKSKLDPYYWKFVQFGTQKMAARPFLSQAADKFPVALDKIQAAVKKALEKYEAGSK